MENLTGYAMGLKGKVYLMRLGAEFLNGGAEEDSCQEYVSYILPELVQLEKQLGELANKIDKVDIQMSMR